jgi:hypothetical protein
MKVATMKHNVGFAFSTATKLALVTMLVGLFLAVSASPKFLGLVFISAAYLGYATLASGAVFIIGLASSLVSKNKADDEIAERIFERANEEPAPSQATVLTPEEAIAEMMSKMTPDEVAALLARFAASMGEAPGKPKK